MTPASANDGTCGGRDFCLFEHTSQSGGRWDNFGADLNYANGDRWWGTSISINDQATSVYNRDFEAHNLCEHSYGRGSCLYVGPGTGINNLSDYEFNDKASSDYF